jgi:hypothetical protein
MATNPFTKVDKEKVSDNQLPGNPRWNQKTYQKKKEGNVVSGFVKFEEVLTLLCSETIHDSKDENNNDVAMPLRIRPIIKTL